MLKILLSTRGHVAILTCLMYFYPQLPLTIFDLSKDNTFACDGASFRLCFKGVRERGVFSFPAIEVLHLQDENEIGKIYF